MYFVFKARIASIYVFYTTVQYKLCNHHELVTPECPAGSHVFEAGVFILCQTVKRPVCCCQTHTQPRPRAPGLRAVPLSSREAAAPGTRASGAVPHP